MKELKPYLRRSLTTSCALKYFMKKRRKDGQEYKPGTISNVHPRIVQNERSVKLLSRETSRTIDFKTASSLAVYMFE